jgi:hypothetical protein
LFGWSFFDMSGLSLYKSSNPEQQYNAKKHAISNFYFGFDYLNVSFTTRKVTASPSILPSRLPSRRIKKGLGCF